MTNTSLFESQSLNDWLFYLESQHHKEIDLGLDRVKTVVEQCNLISFPNSKVVLVAGTNGKGTTIRFMEQYLLAQGHTVGVYSSPHLIRYNERVRINGEELDDQAHIDALSFVEQSRSGTNLTYFEFGTLSAFRLFQVHKPDYVLVEVGLGGRLDATNIIDHDLAVITSIGLDHVDWLGNDLSTIAFEKAGILRAKTPAVIGELAEYDGFNKQIKELKPSIVKKAGTDFGFTQNDESWSFHSQSLNLDGLTATLVPKQNLATAFTSLTTLGLELTAQSVNDVLKILSLPGRMQVIQDFPLQLVDVAHNSHAMSHLTSQLFATNGLAKDQQIDIVLAMMQDKDITETLEHFKGKVSTWYLGALQGNERAASPEYIAEKLRLLGEDNIKIIDNVASAWQLAAEHQQHRLLLGFGSFYTVAEILKIVEV